MKRHQITCRIDGIQMPAACSQSAKISHEVIDRMVSPSRNEASQEKLVRVGRINTVLQTCFFSLAGVLPADEAVAAIKAAIAETYHKRGQDVLDRNFDDVDAAVEALARVEIATFEMPGTHPIYWPFEAKPARVGGTPAAFGTATPDRKNTRDSWPLSVMASVPHG